MAKSTGWEVFRPTDLLFLFVITLSLWCPSLIKEMSVKLNLYALSRQLLTLIDLCRTSRQSTYTRQQHSIEAKTCGRGERSLRTSKSMLSKEVVHRDQIASCHDFILEKRQDQKFISNHNSLPSMGV